MTRWGERDRELNDLETVPSPPHREQERHAIFIRIDQYFEMTCVSNSMDGLQDVLNRLLNDVRKRHIKGLDLEKLDTPLAARMHIGSFDNHELIVRVFKDELDLLKYQLDVEIKECHLHLQDIFFII